MDRAVMSIQGDADDVGDPASGLRQRLSALEDRISAAGGDPTHVTVCAVTKGQPIEVVRAACECGLEDLGESYAQEMLAKVEQMSTEVEAAGVPRWHFVGRLQRNKVKVLAPHVVLWQSVDRPELAPVLARHAPGASVLVQVASSGEEGKGGCPIEDAPALVDTLGTHGLDVRGVMAVGPTDAGVDPRPGFAAVRSLADRLDLAEISMGMSRDLDAAIAEGATMIRPGTALFGPRHVRSRSGQ
jgi:pyridoxal phosphate enzyme (YggS family)